MAARAITALFDDYEEAAKAVDRIEAEGVPHADIAIVASNEGERHLGRLPPAASASAQESDAADGAGAGATVGTVLGGGAGLLAGLGLLAIPGVGPVVAAGWLVAAVTGAGVGAAAGGLLGALTGAGLSHSDAETYAEGVRRGGTLVTVRAEDDKADRVMSLLQKSGSIDLDERAEGWRAQGWTGGSIGDGGVTPVTGHEVAGSDPLVPGAEPRPSADPETAPPTRLPPGGIR
ncbi:general stress protein [Methylobacterium haplocladii]|uniref:General stress protein 17M-like domain-containing protein n=2 Tax=Methylobacterium haplocladii TaxID=1176176 RepID=A0A512IRL5_9HYPH|nr:general stress protein [Methylobacterium haplocladii]GEP00333.1 hypothetical protein MHA02_27200 [Methylobacterium haplocladii]